MIRILNIYSNNMDIHDFQNKFVRNVKGLVINQNVRIDRKEDYSYAQFIIENLAAKPDLVVMDFTENRYVKEEFLINMLKNKYRLGLKFIFLATSGSQEKEIETMKYLIGDKHQTLGIMLPLEDEELSEVLKLISATPLKH